MIGNEQRYWAFQFHSKNPNIMLGDEPGTPHATEFVLASSYDILQAELAADEKILCAIYEALDGLPTRGEKVGPAAHRYLTAVDQVIALKAELAAVVQDLEVADTLIHHRIILRMSGNDVKQWDKDAAVWLDEHRDKTYAAARAMLDKHNALVSELAERTAQVQYTRDERDTNYRLLREANAELARVRVELEQSVQATARANLSALAKEMTLHDLARVLCEEVAEGQRELARYRFGPSDAFCKGDNSPAVLLVEITRLVARYDEKDAELARYKEREPQWQEQVKQVKDELARVRGVLEQQTNYSVKLQQLVESLQDDREVPHPELHHHKTVTQFKARTTALREKYDELIYAVANKHQGETRHQTALRYIQEREKPNDQAASCDQAALRQGI